MRVYCLFFIIRVSPNDQAKPELGSSEEDASNRHCLILRFSYAVVKQVAAKSFKQALKLVTVRLGTLVRPMTLHQRFFEAPGNPNFRSACTSSLETSARDPHIASFRAPRRSIFETLLYFVDRGGHHYQGGRATTSFPEKGVTLLQIVIS